MIFPKKKKKNNTSRQVSLGTSLYDMNKSLIEKQIPDLTDEEMQNKKTLILKKLNRKINFRVWKWLNLCYSKYVEGIRHNTSNINRWLLYIEEGK